MSSGAARITTIDLSIVRVPAGASIELENGYLLAGHLIVGIPKDCEAEHDQRIVERLLAC